MPNDQGQIVIRKATEADVGQIAEILVEDWKRAYRGIMDSAFLDTQLEAMQGVACEKYPGIEINYREDIARTNAGYITESLAAIRKKGFEGAALCWNVMLAPEAHIEAIARIEKA